MLAVFAYKNWFLAGFQENRPMFVVLTICRSFVVSNNINFHIRCLLFHRHAAATSKKPSASLHFMSGKAMSFNFPIKIWNVSFKIEVNVSKLNRQNFVNQMQIKEQWTFFSSKPSFVNVDSILFVLNRWHS